MRMKGYPKWFFAFLIWVLLGLFVSGFLLIPTMLEVRLEWQMFWRLTSDMRILTAAIHTFLSFIVLGVIGALMPIHMRAGWRHRRHHRSGLTLFGMTLLLLMTAIGIYYLSDEQTSLYASLIHLASGAGMIMLAVYHILRGRRYAAGLQAVASH